METSLFDILRHLADPATYVQAAIIIASLTGLIGFTLYKIRKLCEDWREFKGSTKTISTKEKDKEETFYQETRSYSTTGKKRKGKKIIQLFNKPAKNN